MTINIKPKYFIIIGLIIAIATGGYFFKEQLIGLFVSGGQKTVDKALNLFKNPKEEGKDTYSLFDVEFATKLLMYKSYYKISDWKLTTKEKDGKTIIIVDGTTTNGFGAKLDRNVAFITEKKGENWLITDSYDFFVFDKIKDSYAIGKSDMEKAKIMEDVKNKVTIEKWSYESSYGNSVKGNGTIVNNSEIPISFVKIEATYKDRKGNLTNTDDTYAVDSDELLPGQRRNFEWYTSNCYSCEKASLRIKFDD